MSARGTSAFKAGRMRNRHNRSRREAIAEDLGDIRLDIEADDISIKTSGELDVPIFVPKALPLKKKGRIVPSSNWADYPENENTGRYVDNPPNDPVSAAVHEDWRHQILTEAATRPNRSTLDDLLQGPSACGADEDYRWR